MYLPNVFTVDDPSAALDLMEQHPLATLVTTGTDGLSADHLPLVLDRTRGPRGTLLGHMARANPLWRRMESGSDVMAIFHGPHAFVSSGWYAEPDQQVPTWNYAVVHVHGVPRVLHGADALVDILERMTRLYQPEGMPLSLRPPAPLVEELLPAIAGFSLEITRIQAKFKLSQNRDPVDQRRVEEALRVSTEQGQQVAALMRRHVLGGPNAR